MLLAIDATGPWLALGLLDEARERPAPWRRLVERPRGQAEVLFDELAMLLDEAGITVQQITRIVAARGPGSYTGIRVTLAAAQGMALGLKVPIVAVDGLEAIAEAVRARHGEMPVGTVVVALEMGRGRLVAQRFRRARDARAMDREGEPLWLSCDETDERFGDDAALAVPAELAGALADAARWRIPLADRLDALARLGREREPADAPARPLYLRAPRIGPATGPRLR